MNTTVKKLRSQMLRAQYSEDIIRIMFAIARTGEKDAIRVVADQMDVPGEVGHAAARALIEIGPDVIPEMRIRLEADDEDMITNALRVLTHLGDEYAARPEYVHWREDDAMDDLVGEDGETEEAAE